MNDPAPIIELIYAFRRSKTMFAAVSMGVFDLLSERPRRCDELGFRSDTAERLLDACISLGLVEREGGLYRNSAVAEKFLTRKSPDTLAGYILYSNAALYPMWGELEGALREGTPRWEAVLGFPPAGLFDHFFKTKEQQVDFLMGMHGFGRLSSDKVVSAFDLSGFRHLVDLGGATGHLAMAALDRYPDMRATLFDLPPVVEFARGLVTDRVGLVSGDFFRDSMPEADIYALGRILHDWSEEKIRALLEKIHGSLAPGGAILIAEILLDDDHRGPVDAHAQSLNMLICTEGRERSLAEYRILLESSGFVGVEGRRTGTVLDVVFARKPTGNRPAFR